MYVRYGKMDAQCGNWYKFNDVHVEEVLLTDEFMESELFGGKFVVKTDKCKCVRRQTRKAEADNYLRVWLHYGDETVH